MKILAWTTSMNIPEQIMIIMVVHLRVAMIVYAMMSLGVHTWKWCRYSKYERWNIHSKIDIFIKTVKKPLPCI